MAGWQDNPPRDPAGTFQRRHQRSALRQILGCLRQQLMDNGEDESADEHDVARVRRWYVVGANRQVLENGENAEYRIRRDGVRSIEILESNPQAEGLTGTDLMVEPFGDHPPLTLENVEEDATRPGYRRITFGLPHPHYAGDIVHLAWREHFQFNDEAAVWARYWATTTVLNDDYELEMTVHFAEDAQLPDLCWWFGAEPITGLNEIGPRTLGHLVDLEAGRTATHVWESAVTERRRVYGFIWVWLDDDEARARWAVARASLESEAD